MKDRLDRCLVRRGLAASRNQGREFIRAGRVRVGGSLCVKPGRLVASGEALSIDAGASVHRVGRGYDKLAAFLALHPLDFRNRFVLDGGAATGGFTQLALERGARLVLAVDVGSGQLDERLREDPRVISRENCDLRSLRDLPAPCEILLLDLSLVSLREIIPRLAIPFAGRAHLLALVKPQYEVARKELTGQGRVRRPQAAAATLAANRTLLSAQGWTPLVSMELAPGPDQLNREYFLLAQRAERSEQA